MGVIKSKTGTTGSKKKWVENLKSKFGQSLLVAQLLMTPV